MLWQIRSNLLGFLIAGHETTAASLDFATYYLAKYPEHQQTAYNEILSQIGETDEINGLSVKKLSFLDMFIKEGKCSIQFHAMRLITG